jgi:amino acid permease
MKNTVKTNTVKTVLIISVGFVLVYLATKWKWALTASAIIGLLGICSSYLCKKIDFLWSKLAWVLGLIIPNVLLGIIFYLILFPISLLSKLFESKDPLHLKNTDKSIFIIVEKNYEKESFEKTW